MLQFDKIRSMCIERLTETLSVKNCLQIWHICESLDVKPLYLKAKNLSLLEFDVIKYTDSYLLELSIKQLHDYLANVSLCANSELDIFIVCMQWWYENLMKDRFIRDINVSHLFYYFLTFLDFNALSNSDIKVILTYPEIATKEEIFNILNNILKIESCKGFDEKEDLPKIDILLHGKRRVKNYHLCILVDVCNVHCKYFNYLFYVLHIFGNYFVDDKKTSDDRVIPNKKTFSTKHKNVLLFSKFTFLRVHRLSKTLEIILFPKEILEKYYFYYSQGCVVSKLSDNSTCI